MAIAVDEIKLTPAQRALLERLGPAIRGESPPWLEVFGGEIATVRRLAGLALAEYDPREKRATITSRGGAWLEANPRRGRPRVRDGLVVRLDVRVDRATNDRILETATRRQSNPSTVVRGYIRKGLDDDEA